MTQKLTKQGVRDLGDSRPRRRNDSLPRNCSHKRMRYDACEYCKDRGRKVCYVECIDCGFIWTFGEGTNG